MDGPLPLTLHAALFGMLKLPPKSPIPGAFAAASPCFIGRTASELSIVAPRSSFDPAHLPAEWFRLLEIDLTFGTTETGIIKRLVDPLADAHTWVLVIGTHDTDYVLVREDQCERAVAALREAGHSVTTL